MGKRLRKGDKVQVKAGLGYGNSIGTIIGRSGNLFRVRFTTLRKRKAPYIDHHGKKRTLRLGKTGTYLLPAGSLKKHKKKR